MGCCIFRSCYSQTYTLLFWSHSCLSSTSHKFAGSRVHTGQLRKLGTKSVNKNHRLALVVPYHNLRLLHSSQFLPTKPDGHVQPALSQIAVFLQSGFLSKWSLQLMEQYGPTFPSGQLESSTIRQSSYNIVPADVSKETLDHYRSQHPTWRRAANRRRHFHCKRASGT